MSKEKWKAVRGYEGFYEVSNVGRVRSVKRTIVDKNGLMKNLPSMIIVPSVSARGYRLIGLYKNGLQKRMPLARLVAVAFVEGEKKGLTVDHIDENKANNKAANLQWLTEVENRNKHIKYKSKPVTQFSLAGKKIAKYGSIKEASKCTNIARASIGAVIDGIYSQAGGFLWKSKGVQI